MESSRIWTLAMIGTAAGAFSGLFGVGGGSVLVPMLIGFMAYGERLATGTSLAAIIVIALFAVGLQGGVYGNVDVGTGLILGAPAVVGVVFGAAIQQRIPEKAVSFLFSLVLIGVAIYMLVP